MSHMQQLFYVEAEQAEWREVPLPTLLSGKGALVKPLAVARCDLDRFIAHGQHRSQGPFALSD